jgi:hypothetical protein
MDARPSGPNRDSLKRQDAFFSFGFLEHCLLFVQTRFKASFSGPEIRSERAIANSFILRSSALIKLTLRKR